MLRKTARQILVSHQSEYNSAEGPENALTSLVRTHLMNGADNLDMAIDDFLTIFLAGSLQGFVYRSPTMSSIEFGFNFLQ